MCEKLEELIEQEGFETVEEFISEMIIDSISPGICMNDGCTYTTEVEPDCTEGYCELCETQTVKSGMVLAGIY